MGRITSQKILLKRDIDNRLHKTMKLQALYNTQNEYKDYPLTVSRKHIHQAKRCSVASSLPSIKQWQK
jgi:hypothetical protein